jgi:hypothetical protein
VERETGLEKVVSSLPSTYVWFCECLLQAFARLKADSATTLESVNCHRLCEQCVGSLGKGGQVAWQLQPQWRILVE